MIKCFDVPSVHPCYAGHFPNQPIVPGALMLAWLRELTEEKLQKSIGKIDSAKFMQPVLPGDQLSISWQCARENTYSISVRRSEQLALLVRVKCD